MNTKISDSEYDYLENKSRLGLTKEEYSVIKTCLLLEKYLYEKNRSINDLDQEGRIIALVCSAFGFYIDQTGELSFSL